MIWFGLLALGCTLWMLHYRTAAIIVFFFFLTNGFQVIPVTWFDTGVGIQKGADFALLLLMFVLSTNINQHVRLLRTDTVARYAAVFTVFILIGIVYSVVIEHYDVMNVLRAARRFLFILGYFVFRSLKKDEIHQILTIMLGVTVMQCCIFLLQFAAGITLLNRQSDEIMELSTKGAVGDWKRLYNLPEYTVFYLFYLIFTNKIRIRYRAVLGTILAIAFMCTLHRSWLSSFVIVLCVIGFINTQGLFKKIGIVFSVMLISLLPLFVPVLGERLDSGIEDFTKAINGGYVAEKGFDDNLSFRIAHVFERFDFITQTPERMIFGIGFLTEDAGQSQYLNFSVGWRDKYGTRQIDTGDISWSIMFLWLGFVGTALYVIFYFKSMKTLFVHRSTSISNIGIAYMLLYFMISFTSSVYIEISTIVYVVMVVSAALSDVAAQEESYNLELSRILQSLPNGRRTTSFS